MKIRIRHHFLVAGIVFLLVGYNAHAAIVYEQLPGAGSLSLRISSTLDNYGQTPGYTTADDFTLTSNSLITNIQWWGDSNSGGNDFRFTFYADNQGAPGAVLLTSGGSLFSSIVNVGSVYDPVTFYSASLDTAFNANSGTIYWLSIFNQAPDASWRWLSADIPGNGAVQGENPGPPWTTSIPSPPPDLSFQLIATVPLPASIWLFGSGLLTLGLSRKIFINSRR